MAEEQGTPVSQDPVQAGAPTPPAPVQQQQYSSNAPWGNDLSQFGEHAPAVDQYLRERWQPRVTQLEQQAKEAAQGQELLRALQTDPEAYNVQLNRQMYGDQYADQLAASLGRTDLLVGVQPQQAAQQQQTAQPQEGWREDPVYQAMAERLQQEQYDEAKASFLSQVDLSGNKLYADINPDLLDPFAQGAETWEEAVNAYRAYAAQFAQKAPDPEIPPAPPVIGSEAGGTPGSTPTYPKETLNEAIDGIFGEAKPIAPPVMGGQ